MLRWSLLLLAGSLLAAAQAQTCTARGLDHAPIPYTATASSCHASSRCVSNLGRTDTTNHDYNGQDWITSHDQWQNAWLKFQFTDGVRTVERIDIYGIRTSTPTASAI